MADIIRDATHQRHEMGDAILPFVVLRRLDQAAQATRPKAIETAEKYRARGVEGEMLEQAISVAVKAPFYNVAPITFDELIDDPDNLEDNFWGLINGFSPNVRDVLEKFELRRHVDKFVTKDLLYPVVARFCEIDLDPARVSNLDMGYVFEELIRRFSELKNEEAGHHYTPREVIRLMVDLLLTNADDLIYEPGKIVTMLDPACGTGGMLSVAEQRLRELNADVDFRPFGQDFDDQSYAIALSEQLMTGRRELNIALGNSLTDQDAYAGRHFDFVLANPPYGVKWNQYAKPIEREHEEGEDGRYGAGLPRKSDGQLLFVQHMLSKVQPVTDTAPGTRIAIVMNGSPMFSGDAGSGESEIRRWIIENDLLDAIIGLPNDLFYNTGISTYVWILTNNKPPTRKGRVQLIDARDLYAKMKRSLGNKRNELTGDHIATIVSLYGDETDNERSKWVDNADLGYVKVPVQRPRHARVQAGRDAVERLHAHPDWIDLHAKKSADDPDQIRTDVEAALAGLPADGLTLADAKKRLAKADGWSSLLKKSKTAVEDALLLDDPDADPLLDTKGKPVPDPDLRGYETVPLDRDIDEHLAAEVHPHAPDAWAEHDKAKVGYEIPFTEIFYVYEPPPPLEEIDAELRKVEQEILDLLAEVTK